MSYKLHVTISVNNIICYFLEQINKKTLLPKILKYIQNSVVEEIKGNLSFIMQVLKYKSQNPFQLHLNNMQFKKEMTLLQSAIALYFFVNRERIKKIKVRSLDAESYIQRYYLYFSCFFHLFDISCQREHKALCQTQ